MIGRLTIAALLLVACARPLAVEAPTDIAIEQVDGSAPRVTYGMLLKITELDASGLGDDLLHAGEVSKCNVACMKLILAGAHVDEGCIDECAAGHLVDADCMIRAESDREYPACARP